ncbi:MAG: prepilin-type N-terminal cleavage/methylation domain-containing protein [Candidatus Nomurabacteria bacterium]|nr:MAG: prepilin-type N-terminal cleavage/methylation domain-containing protein [Candidatus Nomurabacteria bacterium]
MKRSVAGFTFVEMLVVIAVIGVLAAVIYPNFSQSSAVARDAKRKADLRELQAAIELYKQKNGRYPEGCKGPTTNLTTVWSGHSGTFACASGNQYIIDLAPEFISVLPQDPKLNGANSGYVYAVNDTGSVYKIMALGTVETETVTQSDDFFRCDSSWPLGLAVDPITGTLTGRDMSFYDPAICQRTPHQPNGGYALGSYTEYGECTSAASYANVYALSGGISKDNRGNTSFPDKGMEYDTVIVRCK